MPELITTERTPQQQELLDRAKRKVEATRASVASEHRFLSQELTQVLYLLGQHISQQSNK